MIAGSRTGSLIGTAREVLSLASSVDREAGRHPRDPENPTDTAHALQVVHDAGRGPIPRPAPFLHDDDSTGRSSSAIIHTRAEFITMPAYTHITDLGEAVAILERFEKEYHVVLFCQGGTGVHVHPESPFFKVAGGETHPHLGTDRHGGHYLTSDWYPPRDSKMLAIREHFNVWAHEQKLIIERDLLQRAVTVLRDARAVSRPRADRAVSVPIA